MREILFRAKTKLIVGTYNMGKEDGEWVKGYLRCDCGKWLIYQFETDYADQIAYEVDPYTICQYTGLTDKNGNKIWENDVVKCYADTDDFGNDLYFFYKVIWHESYHCWWLSDIHTLEDEYLHQYNSSDIEVIGNVFDHPDLLKGE